MVKGKLEAQDMTYHWGSEVRVKSLASMNQGNGEKQTRGSRHEGPSRRWSESRVLGADKPRQLRRANEAKVDRLEGYVMLWVIHITYKEQAKDLMIISSGLVDMSDNICLCGINLKKNWKCARQRFQAWCVSFCWPPGVLTMIDFVIPRKWMP
jgi:hypothetical protein